jgi:hypothetical protein
MAEWNLSTDQVTLEQKQGRRSPVRWVRENSIRIAVVVGFVEAAFAWHVGFRLMWLVGVLAVLSYLYLRRRVPPGHLRAVLLRRDRGGTAARDHGPRLIGRPAPHLEIPIPILVVVA